ncbi:hypothetical protein Y590_02970 [Methylobacterium sp. AMS5]|nr:hypothetical protein Y590_02970 [Methylobacterium sp. AMS5]
MPRRSSRVIRRIGHRFVERIRHTLTPTGADGHSRRLFFAYSSQNEPPEVDRDMIFAGDSVFSADDCALSEERAPLAPPRPIGEGRPLDIPCHCDRGLIP